MFSEKISLPNVLQELKNDKNKIKNVKTDKSYFTNPLYKQKDNFFFNSDIYLEQEMLESITRSYLNSKEINFIDEIFFSDVNRLCN